MYKNDTYWYLRRTCSISLTFEVKNSGLLNIYACCSIASFKSSSIYQEDTEAYCYRPFHANTLTITITKLENAQHCGARLTEYLYMQKMEQLRAYDCHQNVAELQATENHKIYTCTQEL